eukprot:XP_014785144.1 PREDICTED: telomerase protein component 1-like [Octopus bimaculoides]
MSLLGDLESDLKIPSEYLTDPLLLKPSLHYDSDDRITKLHESLLKKLENEVHLSCNQTIPSLSLENTLLKDEPSTVMPFSIEPDYFKTQPSHVWKSQQKPKPEVVRPLKRCKPMQRPPLRFNKIRRRSATGLKDLRRKVVKKRKKESESEQYSNEYEELVFDEEMDKDDGDNYERGDKKDDYLQKLKFTQDNTEPEICPDSSFKDIQQLKEKLLRVMGAVLLSSPKFKSSDCEEKTYIENLCMKIAEVDPEFILKVALYSRLQLNIRSASNYLLAFASMHSDCRNFLKKYYKRTVVLPSDWIEVAEFCAYQTANKPFIIGILPSALRKVMVEKFADFDEYQLAKYNKEKKSKNTDQDEDKENMDGYPDKSLLVLYIQGSHLISLLRSIARKRYPESLEDFYKSRLDGTFDESRAGKRMKLPVPETWETQISSHGNKASVWQSLIDHRKLPYMAMLRNIRNLITAEISSKHTRLVLQKLSDENNVIHSKQLPTQFFSAYAVLEQMEKDLNNASDGISSAKKRKKCVTSYSKETLDTYKAAIEKAMKLATNHNLRPVKGRTVILCSLVDEGSKKTVCKSAKGFGKSWTKQQVAVLLALMCNYACEACEIVLWKKDCKPCVADVKPGTILNNVGELLDSVVVSFPPVDSSFEEELEEFFIKKLETREQIDNLIMVDDCGIDGVNNFKSLYRLHVNPNMLFVKVSLSENKSSSLIKNEMGSSGLAKDIEVAGFSDQILT